MITRRIYIPVAFVSGLSLALAFYLADPLQWPWALGSFTLGLLWLAVVRWHSWTFHLVFLGQVGLSIYALVGESQPLLVLLGIIAALICWDLAFFLNRLSHFNQAGTPPSLVKNHLLTLLALSAAGGLLAFLAMSLRLGLNLVTLLILGFLALVSLSILASRLLKSSTEK